MTHIHSTILSTIGNTPVVRLSALEPPGVELYAKLESFNPLGSVKDRMALAVIEAAERDGRLRPGQTVIEATSGNTGIGLAMVCARKGYPLVIVMSEAFSVERRRLMRFLGAKVVLTPASEKGSGMVEKARELAERHGWFWTRQFENAANAEAHERTTAQEILRDFGGTGPDWFVTGFGTGGTLTGVAHGLRAASPGTRIVVAEPENSALLSSQIAQEYREDGTPASTHPAFRPHPVQGWAPDFVPGLVRKAQAEGLIDRIQPIASAEALRLSRALAQREGIFCGISAGATLAAALEVARTAAPSSRILFMVPDTGERYLSTVLFDGIAQEMSDAERAISNSTPFGRFGVASGAVPAATPIHAEPVAEAATAFIETAIGDPEEAVVMFALEWCEFCWAARRFLNDLGVKFRSIDLDSVEMQRTGLVPDIRAALWQRTGQQTIPQIFVRGRPLGGAMDLLAMHDAGGLLPMLAELTVPVAGDGSIVARSYLPTWLASRVA